ncbi:MAG: PEGA domain-containing protein [Methanomicrobiales archaeon]
MDGTHTGIPPFFAGNLTGGNHTVAVSLDGYQLWQQTVTLLSEQILPVVINLSPGSPQKTMDATVLTVVPAPAPQVAGFFAIRGILHYVRKH